MLRVTAPEPEGPGGALREPNPHGRRQFPDRFPSQGAVQVAVELHLRYSEERDPSSLHRFHRMEKTCSIFGCRTPALPAVYRSCFSCSFREDPQPNFVGGTGRLGYPDISLDSLKVPPDSLGLRYISTHWPRGFGVTILEWRHRTGSPLYEGIPLGIRYNGSPADPGPFCRETFSVVYFGFPMYYAQKSQAIQAMRKAIQDIHLN